MNLLAILALPLTMLASPALAAKDMLVVVLEDAAGKTSMHYQLTDDCMPFLRTFMKAKREGLPTTLTFEAPPPATGKVLLAACIRPNGEAVCSEPMKNVACKQEEF